MFRVSVAVVEPGLAAVGSVVPSGVPGPGFVASLDAVSLAAVSDDELLDVMAAWRRVTSWAQASELAVVAEFVRRRQEAHPSSPPMELGEFVADEIALALTLSGGAAGIWAGLAGKLADPDWFPLTRKELAEGRIDLTRAKAIVEGLFGVDTATIRLVEAAVIGDARVLNAGRLRHRVRETLEQLDPQAAAQRRKQASKVRSLQMWATAAGTCDLALREVSQEDAEAIYNKINAVAQAMKSDGDVRPIDAIRHDLGVALLRGTPLPEASRDLRQDEDGESCEDPYGPECAYESHEAGDGAAPGDTDDADKRKANKLTGSGDEGECGEGPSGGARPGRPCGPRSPWPDGNGPDSQGRQGRQGRQDSNDSQGNRESREGLEGRDALGHRTRTLPRMRPGSAGHQPRPSRRTPLLRTTRLQSHPRRDETLPRLTVRGHSRTRP
ncbi:MAG: endonuclease [Actinomycetia bacterium]|nr:endonuclease [Actinomycetes bacterium]